MAAIAEELVASGLKPGRDRSVRRGTCRMHGADSDHLRLFELALEIAMSRGSERLRLNRSGTAIMPLVTECASDQFRFCMEEVGRGTSLILNNADEFDLRLANACKPIDRLYNSKTVASYFFTPPGGKGFGPHFDMSDVLVLQLYGTKSWRIGSMAVQYPYRRLNDLPATSPAEEDLFELKPWDWVLVPGGVVHHAQAGAESASLHLTFSTHAPRVMEVLDEAGSEHSEAARWLDDPPPFDVSLSSSRNVLQSRTPPSRDLPRFIGSD